MKQLISELWCNLMHDAPMWPIHGRYLCGTCHREYPVRWQDNEQHSTPRRSLLLSLSHVAK